ncbi:MAG: radical SAM protein [Patescibacteria group bacterium]|jgi:MoaA/NifB/PqqE/SkfB family radical SAM enzyme
MNKSLTLKKIIKKIGIYQSLRNSWEKLQSRKYRDTLFLIENKKDLPLPKDIIFEPTTRCNLNCCMCPQREERKQLKPDLPPSQTKDLLIKLKKELDIKSISLIGGEVLVRSDILEIIKTLKDLHIKVFISTNGTLIDERLAGEFNKFKNISGLAFSLDGLRERHNQIRGKDYAFDGVKQAVALLKDDFSLTINAVLMDENLNQLVDLARQIKAWGVPNYSLQFEMFSTAAEVAASAKILGLENQEDIAVEIKENQDYSFSQEAISAIIEELNKIPGLALMIQPRLYSRFPEFYLKGELRQKVKLDCKYVNTLRISAQGKMIFCPFIKKSFGSLLTNDIAKVWNSAEVKDFRQKLYANNLTPVCKRCCRLGAK